MSMYDDMTLDWDKMAGLIPALVQDADSGAILMQGYMNPEALEMTQRDGFVTFYSRSKQRLWRKGETSGHTLSVVSIKADCDGDSLLIAARPAGPVCHTGAETCFGDEALPSIGFIGTLERIIEERLSASPEESYTARLMAKGIRKIAQKVGEEGVEVALAGVAEGDEALINESADLMFHLLVLLKARGVTLAQVAACLKERHR